MLQLSFADGRSTLHYQFRDRLLITRFPDEAEPLDMGSQAEPGNQDTRNLLVTRLCLVTQIPRLCLESAFLRKARKKFHFFLSYVTRPWYHSIEVYEL
jgi:hypothetical protein